MTNKIPMQFIAKLSLMILLIGLPIFIISVSSAKAATTHSCGADKGVCYLNFDTPPFKQPYFAKVVYDNARQCNTWECGFGSKISCNDGTCKPLVTDETCTCGGIVQNESGNLVGKCICTNSEGTEIKETTPTKLGKDSYTWNCGGGVKCFNPEGFDDPTDDGEGDDEEKEPTPEHPAPPKGFYNGWTEKIIDIKQCPCPECGKEHYKCLGGNPKNTAVAFEKSEKIVESTNSKGQKVKTTMWQWKCKDPCGNINGRQLIGSLGSDFCTEWKEEVMGPECDETACANTDDCSLCAKCKSGTPEIMTSKDGKCYWRCKEKVASGTTDDGVGIIMSKSVYCSAEKTKKGNCGPAHGTIYSRYAWWSTDSLEIYYTQGYTIFTSNVALCPTGYKVCSGKESAVTGGLKATWSCCPSTQLGCTNIINCSTCYANKVNAALTTPIDAYTTTGGSITTGSGTVGTSTTTSGTTGTIGRGVFIPTGSISPFSY